MKLTLLILSLFVLPMLAESLNPPAPRLASLQRNKTHCEVKWDYAGPVEAFQVMRRSATGQIFSRVLNPDKLKKMHVGGSDVTVYFWIDRKLEEGMGYTYSLVAFTEDGTSLESNALPVQP